MPSQDYIDGFNAAKNQAEAIAKAEFDAAHKDLTTVRLAAGQRERTEVRRTYAEKIAQGIRKLRP
jgi:hypothetical protein